MAVQIAFVFQSPDRTDYLNQRLAGLIGKGIYSGGEILPAGGLTATRAPFLAMGRDGITIWDTEVGTASYTSGIANYHVLHARYNPLGTPSTPVVQELVLTEAEYNGHPEKLYLIVIAKVTPAGVVLLNSEIDYSARDEVGPFGRAQLRGVVDTVAELPITSPNFNRSGDLYIVNNEPAPGGGGLYMWEGGTSSWRLVAARGAATLDGAYDNNGAGGPPGYGRTINVDAQAVELLQDTTSQRLNDIANAALRIRKASTVEGDGAIDIALAQDKDTAAVLVRTLFTSGTDVQADEPVNVSGSTLTCTRVVPVASWNSASIHKAHMLLVELSGSAAGNDGLFVAVPTGPSTCSVKNLDASTPVLANESGITANFFSVRYSIGAAGVARLTEYDLSSTRVASVEFYGVQGTAGIGKVVYYDPATLDYIWQYRATLAGATSSLVAFMTAGGSLVLQPPSGLEDNPAFQATMNSNLYSAAEIAHLGSGIGLAVSSSSGNAVYAETTTGTAAVYGEGLAGTAVGVHGKGIGAGVYGESNGGIGVLGINDNVSNDAGVYGKHTGDYMGIFGESLGSGIYSFGVAGSGGSGAAGVYGIANGSGETGVMGEATALAAVAGVYAKTNQSFVPALLCSSTAGLSALGLKVAAGDAEFWDGLSISDDSHMRAYHTGGDHLFYTAIRTKDETSPADQYSFMLDYHGRPCRGNHFTDDFHYPAWVSIVTSPDPFLAFADTGNGSDVDASNEFLGGAVRLHLGVDIASYAYFVGMKSWVARRSDAGGVVQSRFFFRVLVTGAPTNFFVGFTNHQNGFPSETKSFGVATGAGHTATSQWNFYYNNTVTAHSQDEQIQLDPIVTWNWYNIELHVISATQVVVKVNDAPESTHTLAGGDTFTSELWAPTVVAQAPVVGGSDYYVDYMDVWHDLALKWNGGYATPSIV